MSRYTNYPESLKNIPRSQLVSTIPKPKSPHSAVTHHSLTRPNSPKVRPNEKALSERYTNTAYERIPSPKDRFQALASGCRGTAVVNNRLGREEFKPLSNDARKKENERISAPHLYEARKKENERIPAPHLYEARKKENERIPAPHLYEARKKENERISTPHLNDAIKKGINERNYSQVPPIPKPRTKDCSLLLKASHSAEISSKRILERECGEQYAPSHPLRRVRPMTADMTAPKLESANLERQVLSAVKRVLSRAVFLEGKIDENNIDTILTNMKNIINLDDNKEDETPVCHVDSSVPEECDVKPSVALSVRSGKPLAGIIRKTTSESVKAQKPYRRIYTQADILNSHSSWPSRTQECKENQDAALVCLNLPDLKKYNVSKSETKEEKHPKISKMTVFKNDLNIKYSQRDGFLRESKEPQETRMGDFQSKGSSHFWSTDEDVKLRSYIESMVYNMRNQLNCESSGKEIIDEIDSQGTVCKSFCICKVCVSKKKSPSKQTITISNHSIVAEETNMVDATVKKQIKGVTNKATTNVQEDKVKLLRTTKRLRLQKLPSERLKGSFNTLSKNNPEVKHDESSTKPSTPSSTNDETAEPTIFPPGKCQISEDMYLERRRQRSPVRSMKIK